MKAKLKYNPANERFEVVGEQLDRTKEYEVEIEEKEPERIGWGQVVTDLWHKYQEKVYPWNTFDHPTQMMRCSNFQKAINEARQIDRLYLRSAFGLLPMDTLNWPMGWRQAKANLQIDGTETYPSDCVKGQIG